VPALKDGVATRTPWGRVILVAALFSLLALGLFAPDRGFLQDEPWALNLTLSLIGAQQPVGLLLELTIEALPD